MIKHELADLFWKNSVHKRFVINYDGGTITNSDLFMEEFELEESLSSEEELRFGSCEASVVRFPVSSVFTSLNGKVLDVSVVLDHNEDKPLKIGKYKVASDIPTADRKRKDITAYDAMYDVVNANVAEWYNAILPNADSTVTFKQFRDSFFGYFGIEQVEVSLINDSMIVTKTIQPTELSGSVVANAICELNGCFGHINRDGLMDYVFLKGFAEALYPSDNLYPAEDLFPEDSNYHKYTKSDYPSGGCDYQEYVVHEITGLEIRQAENSVGAFVGERDNPYVVSDNFLTYGKSTDEMTTIAENMFGVIKDIEYRPFTLKTFRGNPCVEVGDGIKIYADNQIIESYVLNRTLTGIQALSDSFETRGREYRTAQVNSFEKSLIQLRGKTNTLERTIDETRSEITKQTAETKEYADGVAKDALDEANKNTDEKLKDYSTTTEMRSEISQSADAINLSVSEQIKETKKYTDTSLEDYSTTTEMDTAIKLSAEGITSEVSQMYTAKSETKELSSRVEQTAEEISSKVEKGEIISEINQSAEEVKIQASKIALEGTVTANENVTISADGKLTAKNGSFEGLVEATALYVDNAILMRAAGLGITTLARMIWLEKWSDIYWQYSNPGLRLYEQTRIGDIEFSGSGIYAKDTSTWRSGGTSLIQNSAGIVGLYPQSFRPQEDSANTFSLGWSSIPWNAIYSKDGTIQKSDANMKHDIFDISEKYEQLFFETRPCTYVFNDGKRTHIGTISQWVEEALEKVGLTPEEFAGFCKDQKTVDVKDENGNITTELVFDKDGNPEYTYSLRYEEWIMLIVHMVQKLYKKHEEQQKTIDKQQSEIDELKKSVYFLMEKLGGMSNE